MKKLFYMCADICRKKLGIQLTYIKRTTGLLGLTAVRSAKGFWYAGDVFDSSDIAYNLVVNGIVEKEDTELVEKILTFFLQSKKDIHFYDIGANTGYYGIFAVYLGKGKIDCVSFEPLKEHADCIRSSAFLNRIEPFMKIYEMALGSREATVEMKVFGSGSSITENFLPDAAYPTRTVTVTTLDAIIKKDSLPNPTFVKIDVEGYEYEVLKGAIFTLTQTKPVFFIEIIKFLNPFLNPNYQATFDLMKNVGYECHASSGSGDGARMFLFLHPDVHVNLIKHLS